LHCTMQLCSAQGCSPSAPAVPKKGQASKEKAYRADRRSSYTSELPELDVTGFRKRSDSTSKPCLNSFLCKFRRRSKSSSNDLNQVAPPRDRKSLPTTSGSDSFEAAVFNERMTIACDNIRSLLLTEAPEASTSKKKDRKNDKAKGPSARSHKKDRENCKSSHKRQKGKHGHGHDRHGKDRAGKSTSKSKKVCASRIPSSKKQLDFIGDYEFAVVHSSDMTQPICLSKSQMADIQENEAESLAEIFSIPKSSAIALLRYVKWDKDRAISLFLEGGNEALGEAGVMLGNSDSTECSQPQLQECIVCAEVLEDGNLGDLSMPCGHALCISCWQQYLETQISEGMAAFIPCPGFKCCLIVPEDFVRSRISAELLHRYKNFLLNQFVDSNASVKWCPKPDCGNAVNVSNATSTAVSCTCGYSFWYATRDRVFVFLCSCRLFTALSQCGVLGGGTLPCQLRKSSAMEEKGGG